MQRFVNEVRLNAYVFALSQQLRDSTNWSRNGLNYLLQIRVISQLTQPSTLNTYYFSMGANLTTTWTIFHTCANLTITQIFFLRVPTAPYKIL